MHFRDLDNGTAESIGAALVQFLGDRAIPITKLQGFGSDGVAVMTGRLTGVATCLKRHSSSMIAIHCGNHRLALAAAHAANGIIFFKWNPVSNPPSTVFLMPK